MKTSPMSILYVLKEGQKRGPFTAEELEGQVVAGEFCPEDQYWMEGMETWEPLSGIMEYEVETSPGTVAKKKRMAARPSTSKDVEVVFYDSGVVKVTAEQVELPDVIIPLVGIAKAEANIEKIRRFGPMVGSILLGVVIICLVFLDIPKTTATHWILWGAILLGLALWWGRCFYSGFRTPRCLLVIELVDGNEHVVSLSSEEAIRSSDAICQAVATCFVEA